MVTFRSGQWRGPGQAASHRETQRRLHTVHRLFRHEPVRGPLSTEDADEPAARIKRSACEARPIGRLGSSGVVTQSAVGSEREPPGLHSRRIGEQGRSSEQVVVGIDDAFTDKTDNAPRAERDPEDWHPITYFERFSYSRWWIILVASVHPLWAGIFVSGQSRQVFTSLE